MGVQGGGGSGGGGVGGGETILSTEGFLDEWTCCRACPLLADNFLEEVTVGKTCLRGGAGKFKNVSGMGVMTC